MKAQHRASCCSVSVFFFSKHELFLEERRRSNRTTFVWSSFFSPRLRCPRFDAGGGSCLLGQAHRALKIMLGISSNHTRRGNNSSSTCGCVVTGKFTRHGCAPPNRQGMFGKVRGSVGSVSAMASDSVSAQVRRLSSSLSIASCTLLA